MSGYIVFLAVRPFIIYGPVSYTHLDVYKRQLFMYQTVLLPALFATFLLSALFAVRTLRATVPTL